MYTVSTETKSNLKKNNKIKHFKRKPAIAFINSS